MSRRWVLLLIAIGWGIASAVVFPADLDIPQMLLLEELG